MKKQQAPEWISEKEAADLMRYKPYTLRRKVKSGSLDIAFTTPTGRRYQYNKHDIDRTLLQSSNFLS